MLGERNNIQQKSQFFVSFGSKVFWSPRSNRDKEGKSRYRYGEEVLLIDIDNDIEGCGKL